eukprot:g6703.t1
MPRPFGYRNSTNTASATQEVRFKRNSFAEATKAGMSELKELQNEDSNFAEEIKMPDWGIEFRNKKKQTVKWEQCTVVGRGPSLIGSNLGKVIDSSSIVIRLNDDPIEGYEADVGEKIKIRVLYYYDPDNL